MGYRLDADQTNVLSAQHYYVELANTGKRTKITAFVYQQLINAYGYYHILRTPNIEVITCRG